VPRKFNLPEKFHRPFPKSAFLRLGGPANPACNFPHSGQGCGCGSGTEIVPGQPAEIL